MATLAHRLTGGALPLALAAGLLGLGVVGQRAVRSEQERVHDADFRAAAETVIASFDSAAGQLGARAHLLPQLAERARASGTPNEALVGTILTTLATVTPGKSGTLVGSVQRVAGADVDLTAVIDATAPALELARDSGGVRTGPPVGGSVLVAVPTYSGPAAPVGTGERRSRLTGWVVGVVDPAALVPGSRSSGRLSSSISVGSSTATGPPLAGSLRHAVVVGGEPWVLTVSPLGVPDHSAVSWLVLLLGVAGAVAVLALGGRHGRHIGRLVAERTTLERETKALAELGPLLQQSLDLGEVLPAVAVRLADEFALTRFAIQLIGDHGELVEAFSFGTASPSSVVEVSQAVPDSAPAGVGMRLSLLRAGRVVGVMSVSSAETMGRSQLNTLVAVADLIAVATYNAELYDREQQAVRRLQELDRLKDSFLGTISHELRTPITAISGFVALLHDRWDEFTDSDRREFVGRVHRNAASLGLLVDELLDFARLERQALTVSPVPLDVDVVVGGVVSQLLPLLGEHEVVTHLEPHTTAETDAAAVERVLANLLTNAAKFSPAGTRIDVDVRRRDGHVELEVRDQGAGILPEERQRVFRRFYRGENDAARATRGAGIGLAVVRELVLQLGGTVEALPNEPRGTRMLVRLPSPKSPARPDTLEAAVPKQHSQLAGTSSRRTP